MSNNIFNSSAEEGLLKSVGPYRIIIADSSYAGVKLPVKRVATTARVVGEVKVYGTSKIVRKVGPIRPTK